MTLARSPSQPVRRAVLPALVASVLIVLDCSSAPPPTPPPTLSPTSSQSPSAVAIQPTSASATSPTPSAILTPSVVLPTASPVSPSPSVGSSASPSPAASPSGGNRPAFASVDDAYAQSVSWHGCAESGASGMCATVFVPTTYEQPNAGTTAIAVARFGGSAGSATKPDLFLNPGGPGASGIGFAAVLSRIAPGLSSNFAIVGFDPRGTGSSDALECLDTSDLDALNAFDPTPETPAERQKGIELIDAQGEACSENSGLLAAHVTTIETARDMDIVRAVLGDDKMDYFGTSYGTFLGTTYAALFPNKVHHFVLDGALVPNVNSMEVAEVQTQGLEAELTAYAKDCVSNDAQCPLGRSVDAAKQSIRNVLVDADSNPLPTSDPKRPLTQDLAFFGIVDTMYNPASWPNLSSALAAALSGNGEPLLALSDDYFGRSGGQYTSNMIQANQAINCLDEQVAGGPTTIPESKFVGESAAVGDIMWGLADRGCGDWPLRTTLTAPDYSAPGTPPILVVGTTRDPATPYIWAQQLARTLDNGVLLTRVGDGHTAYLSGNPCIVAAVDAFLAQGTVPAVGTKC